MSLKLSLMDNPSFTIILGQKTLLHLPRRTSRLYIKVIEITVQTRLKYSDKWLHIGWFMKLYTILLFLSFPLFAADKFIPTPLLMLDPLFSHHVILAEKNAHKLYLYKQTKSGPVLQKTYQMATGKKSGDKIFQGDHRTPEGIYFFTDFIDHEKLIVRHGKQGEIYGVGAFVMDYPNPIDVMKEKTGSGIWLHSTNDETRIEKGLDSRGCLVTHNQMLIELSEYLELNRTPIIVVHDLKYLPHDSWIKVRNELKTTIESWREAWEKEDIRSYLSHYHPTQFFDKRKGRFENFAKYKKSVFSRHGSPIVKVKNLSFFQVNDYAVAVFQQDYQSNSINDIGRKILYLKKDKYYNWKIVNEKWTKHGIAPDSSESNTAFRPEMRFFKTKNPGQILGDSWKKVNN